MKYAKKLLVPFLLAFTANGNAVVIDNGNHVTVDGVEWLDLSVTDGWTYNQTLELTGYHVASVAEFSNMFLQFADPTDQLGVDIVSNGPCSINEQSSRCDSVGDTNFTNNLFSQYFGPTQDGTTATLHNLYSYGFYTNGIETFLGGTAAIDTFDPLEEDILFEYHGRTRDYEHIANGTTQWGLSGWFMVKDSPTSTDIPEPSAFAIIGLALIGLGFARKRDKN